MRQIWSGVGAGRGRRLRGMAPTILGPWKAHPEPAARGGTAALTGYLATPVAALRIAILDTGINPSHRQVGPVAGGVRVSWRGGKARLTGNRLSDWTDEIGHGTAVAATVSDGLPRAAFTLLSVRVFGRRMDAPPQCLAAGVRWAVAQGAHIVNLSAGVPAGSDPEGERELGAAWTEAAQAGLSLIAPWSSRNTPLIPGALSAVAGSIGVEADPELDYGRLTRRGDVMVGSPWARPLPPLPREKNFSGVSFAVAAVTNRVAGVRLGAATELPVELDAAS